MPIRKLVLFAALLVMLPSMVYAETGEETEGMSRSTKTTLLNAGGAAAILAWGFLNWDYGARSPHTDNEEWFGSTTKEGGADKLGHLYTGHLLTASFASVYRYWGYDDETASRYGFLSSIGMTSIMEIGDSFSADYGFSYEDFTMNILGAGIGYLLDSRPDLRSKVDLRWEYWPSLSNFEGDFLTDYEHSKYLFAVKGAGFEALQDTLAEYVELHFGFYARERDHNPGDDRRTNRYLYAGVGINLARLLKPVWETRLFEFWQPAYTYIPVRKGLD